MLGRRCQACSKRVVGSFCNGCGAPIVMPRESPLSTVFNDKKDLGFERDNIKEIHEWRDNLSGHCVNRHVSSIVLVLLLYFFASLVIISFWCPKL